MQYQPHMTRRQALQAERLAESTPTPAPRPVPAPVLASAFRPAELGSRQPVPPASARSSGRRRSTYQAVPATVLVRQPGRHRFALTGPLTFAGIVLTASLTLTHALPSSATPENTDPDANAEAAAGVAPDGDTAEPQALTVDDVKIVTFLRDGYTVVAPPPPPPPPAPVPAPAPATAGQQVTGVSSAEADSSGSGSFDVRWPFASPSPINSRFGPRAAPCGGCSSNHKGLDFNPGNGTQIQSIAGGVVRSVVSSDSGLGVHVIIEHEIDGAKVTSTYAHMQFGSLAVTKGQVIAAGDPVGRVGNTGASTGAHLHFEIAVGGEQIDPYAWLKAFAG